MNYPKINGYRAYVFDRARFPDTEGFSPAQDCSTMLPELELLLEHFDVEKIRINLTSGAAMTIQKKGTKPCMDSKKSKH
jgi:hypothetical protein